MKLLTGWDLWWQPGREEYKFHNDLILEPGEKIVLTAPDGHIVEIVAPPGTYVKVHMDMCWEERDTLFAEKVAVEADQGHVEQESGETRELPTRPCKWLDAEALEHWAEHVALHLYSAWELSDASEYMDFWEWFDLNHPGEFLEFEKWFRERSAAETKADEQ